MDWREFRYNLKWFIERRRKGSFPAIRLNNVRSFWTRGSSGWSFSEDFVFFFFLFLINTWKFRGDLFQFIFMYVLFLLLIVNKISKRRICKVIIKIILRIWIYWYLIKIFYIYSFKVSSFELIIFPLVVWKTNFHHSRFTGLKIHE